MTPPSEKGDGEKVPESEGGGIMSGGWSRLLVIRTDPCNGDAISLPEPYPNSNGVQLADIRWKPPEVKAKLGEAREDTGERGVRRKDIGVFIPG